MLKKNEKNDKKNDTSMKIILIFAASFVRKVMPEKTE